MRNNRTFITVISILAIFTFVLTGSMIFGSIVMGATAAAQVQAIPVGAEIEDYDFVVIEEEQLPAAAKPEVNHSNSALWVIAIVIAAVLLVSYELWYESCSARIAALAAGEEDEPVMLAGIGRLHPIHSVMIRREMEARAAQRYFK